MIKRNKIILSITGIITVLLITIGISYAYFTANLEGGEDSTTITVTGGTMNIVYNGGANISIANIIPSDNPAVTKTFTVTGNNTTDLEMIYQISLVVESNTFSAAALKYKLISTNTDSNGDVASSITTLTNIGTGAKTINLGTGSFTSPTNGNKVHTYKLEIYFPDTGTNQNIDQDKLFQGYVLVNEGNNTSENRIYASNINVSMEKSHIEVNHLGKKFDLYFNRLDLYGSYPEYFTEEPLLLFEAETFEAEEENFYDLQNASIVKSGIIYYYAISHDMKSINILTTFYKNGQEYYEPAAIINVKNSTIKEIYEAEKYDEVNDTYITYLFILKNNNKYEKYQLIEDYENDLLESQFVEDDSEFECDAEPDCAGPLLNPEELVELPTSLELITWEILDNAISEFNTTYSLSFTRNDAKFDWFTDFDNILHEYALFQTVIGENIIIAQLMLTPTEESTEMITIISSKYDVEENQGYPYYEDYHGDIVFIDNGYKKLEDNANIKKRVDSVYYYDTNYILYNDGKVDLHDNYRDETDFNIYHGLNVKDIKGLYFIDSLGDVYLLSDTDYKVNFPEGEVITKIYYNNWRDAPRYGVNYALSSSGNEYILFNDEAINVEDILLASDDLTNYRNNYKGKGIEELRSVSWNNGLLKVLKSEEYPYEEEIEETFFTEDKLTQITLPNGAEIVDVKMGNGYLLILDYLGNVWGWGWYQYPPN